MNAMFNQICSRIASSRHWAQCRRSTSTGQVAKWHFCAVAMLICLIGRVRGQLREVHIVSEHRPMLHPLRISARHRQPAVIQYLSPMELNSLGDELRPSGFNLHGTTTTGYYESLPELSADAWPTERQWPDAAGQYRSINARLSNPAKSPLSPRAFFSSSAHRRQLALLSAARPTSLSAAFRGSAASVPTAGKQATVDRTAVGQIDRMSHRPRQTFHSVASENIDNATIEDVYERVGLKRTAKKQAAGDSHKARRISRRKLEHYDNSVAHIAPMKVANKKASGLSATISTRIDKQANDATTEANDTRGRPLDTAPSDPQMKNRTEAKYANERAKEDYTPDITTDGTDNPDKGARPEQSKAEHGGANSNLPPNVTLAGQLPQQPQYVADQSALAATVSPAQPESTKDAVVTVLEEERSDESNSPESETGTEPREDDLPEEEDFRINQYSSSVPASRTSSKDYSNRDRGFGFIKAWAWDRAENYRVKNGREGEHSTKSKSKQLGYSN